MSQHQDEKSDYFWQEKGERTFLYILVTVLLLAIFMYFFSQSAQAQNYALNLLNSAGKKSFASYEQLKSGTVGLKERALETWEVAADQTKAEKRETEGEEPQLKNERSDIKIKLIYFKKQDLEENQSAVQKVARSANYQLEKLEQEEEQESVAAAALIKNGKYIEVDLSSQRLYIFQNGQRLGSYLISSGSSTYPTPTGRYQVSSKSLNAYSAKYDLYMPYWMAFIGSRYGIHELPEYANGYKEGQEYLGQPVSHGCIRLGVGAAAAVYNFAPVGTPVIIHY